MNRLLYFKLVKTNRQAYITQRRINKIRDKKRKKEREDISKIENYFKRKNKCLQRNQKKKTKTIREPTTFYLGEWEMLDRWKEYFDDFLNTGAEGSGISSYGNYAKRSGGTKERKGARDN